MRKCENCGANLDSGERCDCERESDREKLDRACRMMASAISTMRMRKLTRAEFIARAVADMVAEKERIRRAIWRGRWEAAIAKGEHIEQMRRRKR